MRSYPRVSLACWLVVFLYSMIVSVGAYATNTAGTTSGKFSVTPNGAAQYTVPIQVPPGINGMEPHLALGYSSQQGNGIAGVGWSLSGLDSVRRCPGSIAVDGARSGISYSAQRFCLNGQRLVQTGTGSGYREYHTELENFSRIRAYGSTPSNPTYFQIWTTSGRTIILGNTADSNFKPSGGNNNTLVWSVNRIEDRSGNYLTVSYTADDVNGEYRVSSIDYTSNDTSAPATASARNVTFSYEARADVLKKYVAGSVLTTSQRLKAITTKFNAAVVRSYTLGYQAEATGSARSRLASLSECGSDGACYANPLAVGWRNDGNATFTAGASAGVATGNEFGQWNRLVDMNGDGIKDIFSVTNPASGTVSVQLGLATGGYGAAVVTNGVISNSANGFNELNELADVDGDGLVDIFRVSDTASGTVIVYPGKSDGTFDTVNTRGSLKTPANLR